MFARTVTLADIKTLLAGHVPLTLDYPGRQRASVVMVLQESTDGLAMLFIQRAKDERDPWSNNIGFPGGRPEEHDGGLRETAERETREEIGLDLRQHTFLGRLSDIIGANLPVQVSCFVYGLAGAPVPFVLNPEMHDAFWVTYRELTTGERHITTTVNFDGRTLQAPVIRLPQPDKPVLWGITYRLVMQLLTLLDTDGNSEDVYRHSRLD